MDCNMGYFGRIFGTERIYGTFSMTKGEMLESFRSLRDLGLPVTFMATENGVWIKPKENTFSDAVLYINDVDDIEDDVSFGSSVEALRLLEKASAYVNGEALPFLDLAFEHVYETLYWRKRDRDV